MADILIRGGKMPLFCAECDSIRRVSKHDYVCNITGDSIDYTLYARPHWCPKSKLTPHGRLIDADDLRAKYFCGEGVRHDLIHTTLDCVLYFIDNAETVIEASEEKT